MMECPSFRLVVVVQSCAPVEMHADQVVKTDGDLCCRLVVSPNVDANALVVPSDISLSVVWCFVSDLVKIV